MSADRVPDPLRINLLHDLRALSGLLVEELGEPGATHAFNAFLISAGMNQIVEDHLDKDLLRLSRLSKVARIPGWSIAARLLRSVWLRRRTQRRLARIQRELSNLVDRLAERVVSESGQATQVELRKLADALTAALGRMPRHVLAEIVRLPSCFRSFDQHPRDVACLAQRFAERWPERKTPLHVVGLRTSGSYLGPLAAACLRELGFEAVKATTMRPGAWWLATAGDDVRSTVRSGGRVLLVDDPPTTGSAYVTAARAVERLGASPDAITCLAALFGSAEALPQDLHRYDVVALPHEDWWIHQRLGTDHVRLALRELLTGKAVRVIVGSEADQEVLVAVSDVQAVRRLPLTLPLTDAKALLTVRGHERALFEVTLVESDTGDHVRHLVYTKGTGLGYFGEHSLATGDALAEFVPQTYGCLDGLLFREWLPEELSLRSALDSLPQSVSDAHARQIARYVVARRDRLGVAADVAAGLEGRNPVWQRSSVILSRSFGRLSLLARPVLDLLAARLLAPARPVYSVVDGSTSIANWFRRRSDASHDRPLSLAKVDFDEYAFNNYDRYCNDAAFDVAIAGASCSGMNGGEEFASSLRRHYEAFSGDSISEARWLLYQVTSAVADRDHLRWLFARLSSGSFSSTAQDNRQSCLETIEELERTAARAHMWFMGDAYMSSTGAPNGERGRLCAIDVDGVLETRHLGYSATTPAGAQALRALARHGYRPLLATGRSVGEVRDRCRAYRLAGGVAEYGAAVYFPESDSIEVVLTPADQALLERWRERLGTAGGVFIDPTYRYAVRAYCLDPTGDRRCLPEAEVAGWLSDPQFAGIKAVRGDRQTDFTIDSIDKATGLRMIAGRIGAERSAKFLEFAVGDTEHDLPMFAVAKVAMAPGNADRALRLAASKPGRRVKIASRPFQAGLLQSVGRLIGHDPVRCEVCSPAEIPEESRTLLAALETWDRGKAGKLASVARLQAAGARLRSRRTGSAASVFAPAVVPHET